MNALAWRLIPFVLFIVLALFLWRGLSLDPQHLPSVKMGKPVPMFSLPELDNDKYLTNNALHGHVSLLNIWASWCPSCSDEQVFLLKLAREGMPIYGLNYKDDPDNARLWLSEWGNPYKRIGKDLDGKTAIDLGVYGAPETFLIDASGVIRYRYTGALNENVWEKEFIPRIKALNHEANHA